MKTKDLLKTKLSSLAGPPLRQPRPLDERLRPARRQPDDHDDRDGRQSGIRLRRPQATVETFTQVPDYTVTFQADGATVKTMTVEDGYVLKDSDYPAVPTKTGYTGEWVKYTSAVHSNVTVSAPYTKDVVTYTVTFVADGVTVKTMTVEDGYTLKDFDYPTVPSKTGYNGMWKKYTSAIHKNVTVYAIYRALTTAKHTVKFVARLEVVKTMTVSDGYTLQSSDYPTVPPREGYRGMWERYSSPVYEDITINAVYHKLGDIIPTQPTDPDEIMSGGEGEPVEADVPAEDETVAPQGMHVTGTQTVTHEYLTLNGKVARETIRTNNTLTAVLDFVYDESGKPFALKYSTNGTSFQTYYYVLNLQGDVVKLIHYIPGFEYESVATYEYDAWGNVSSSGRLAEINPLRYRGYYYDNETGFYYLQSRYYDPANRRFINADSYQSTGQGFVGTNMFAYCNNNPITAIDESGKSVTAIIIGALICAAIGGIDAYLSAKTSGASTNEALWQGAIGAVSGAVTSVVAAIPAIGPPAATLIGAGIGFVSSTASEVTHYAFNKDDPDYEFDTAESCANIVFGTLSNAASTYISKEINMLPMGEISQIYVGTVYSAGHTGGCFGLKKLVAELF